MDAPDVETSLARLLLVADRLRGRQAARHGLMPIEWMALTHVHLAGPLNQRELSGCIGLSTGAVTGLVDRLERHGVAERQPHPTDRRALIVTLTERGRALLAEADAEFRAVREAVPSARRPALADDLTSLADRMAVVADLPGG